jgi:ABC-type glycerol-3-phosphate transport system substrate-binding protein
MTKFQLIVTGIFGAFLVIGIIIFSAYRGSSEDAAKIVVWGTISNLAFNDIIQSTSLHQNKLFDITYVQKSEASFDADFIDALASGTGPDLFILPSNKILKHYNKIFLIPYNVFTERQFKDSFIEGAEIYMAPDGIVGLPIYTDPLVMYWNRAIFRDAKLTEPPKYWDEFYNLANLISVKDGALNILKSAVAFGEFANVTNAKEIIVNLAMQAGTPVTLWSENKVQSVFNFTFDKPTVPAEAAVNFYTEFGNPTKPSYSWNRSLPSSANYFLGGDLALYFGFASEVANLQVKNPNLNFDVARVPVSREGGTPVSYADFGALAITKSSKNPNAAFQVASILSGSEGASAFSAALRLPSARRDLLNKRPENAYQSVFRDSAIRAKGWLDPDPAMSDQIFKNMIESITSGRARTTAAVSRAHQELSNLLFK